MSEESQQAAKDIDIPRLFAGLVVLVAGALVMGAVPLLKALDRLGWVGTALLLLGILAASIVFYRAFEHLKPAFRPMPRRDLGVIVFAGSLIGLWTFYFTNELVTVVVMGGLGALVLLPEDWQQRANAQWSRFSKRA